MTKINLLPPEKRKEKRVGVGRSYIWLAVALPLIVLVLMGFWFFKANSGIADKDRALKDAKAELQDWRAKNKELEVYKARLEEIAAIEQTVVTALKNRIYWARILNEIAIMCPTNIWLTSLNATSEKGGEGAAPAGSVTFEGYALQCPNRLGMGGFFPYYPDYKPIAYWLERMAQIVEFSKVWLSNAAAETIKETEITATATAEPTPGTTVTETASVTVGTWVIRFSSQATLNIPKAVVAEGAVSSTPSGTTPPATPSKSESGQPGGETE